MKNTLNLLSAAFLVAVYVICTSFTNKLPPPDPIVYLPNVWKLNQLYADEALVPDPTGKLYKMRYVFGDNGVFLMTDSTTTNLMSWSNAYVVGSNNTLVNTVTIKTFNNSQTIAVYQVSHIDSGNLILTCQSVDGNMKLEYRFILDPTGGAFLNNANVE